MQAVAQNTESASVLGINVPRMIFYTFAINALLAAAAALLVTPTYLAKFDMGAGHWATRPSLPPSSAASTTHAAHCWAVLIVGMCENLAAAYISSCLQRCGGSGSFSWW
jgi:branched-chain amino acid transport system permease protein